MKRTQAVRRGINPDVDLGCDDPDEPEQGPEEPRHQRKHCRSCRLNHFQVLAVLNGKDF